MASQPASSRGYVILFFVLGLVVLLLVWRFNMPLSSTAPTVRHPAPVEALPPEGTTKAQRSEGVVRSLVEEYAWAQQWRESIRKRAAYWLQRTDDDLWHSVTPQALGRARYVNRKIGCPTCGDKIFRKGYYPWKYRPAEKPWKLQCPVCMEWFPKNDFWKYYMSGLDASGTFDPQRGDRALLINDEHPAPDDPLHRFGVDDGAGFKDEKGNRFLFVACYNAHAHWGISTYPASPFGLTSGCVDLAYAYLATGDMRYATKAGRFEERTPAMAAGLTDHVWSLREGLTFTAKTVNLN